MIRLIAADLDDTLLDDHGKLPEENRIALLCAMERGAAVTIATGRMTGAASRFAERLGVRGPLILYNGALVYDPATGETVYERAIPLDLTLEILRAAEEDGVYIQYFDRNGYYYARHGSYSRLYGGHIGVAGTETGAPLSGWVRGSAMKLLAVTREEDRDAVCACFQARFGERVHVMPTRRQYIEFVMGGVDKGAALAALAVAMGLSRDEVCAFGDAQNDVGMLAWAKYGCCVRNGCEAARAAAARVIPPNTACGVAKAIDGLIAEGLL